MNDLVDTETKIREIGEKFSNGLYVFVGLVKSKREIFNELKIHYSEELREQLENIINNQLIIIDYLDDVAIPYLILDIKRLLYEFGLKDDPETNDFLQPMLKSLFYALEQFKEYKNAVLKQQEILQKSPDKLRSDAKIFVSVWLKYEESQVQRFFEKFDKIKIQEFNQYIKTIGFEMEHAIKLGTFIPGGGVGGLATGAVFAKAVQFGFIASGIGLENFPVHATNVVEILFAFAGMAGAIYIAKSQLKENISKSIA